MLRARRLLRVAVVLALGACGGGDSASGKNAGSGGSAGSRGSAGGDAAFKPGLGFKAVVTATEGGVPKPGPALEIA